ncbi:MAG: hypothetical protein GY846_04800 [Deltaproteobacteria bacterium]|nr:hypothetical protein [Deltaproteobacteria bacterium]
MDTVYSPKGFEGKCPGYVFSHARVDVMLTGNKNLAAIQCHIQKKNGAEIIS